MGGNRGRLISNSDRCNALKSIEEAVKGGARQAKACELLGVSLRTVERWQHAEGEIDKRAFAKRLPANKLRAEERQQVLQTANSVEYSDLPPCQIVPRLADKGIYIASESTFYRIFREEKLLAHRGKSRASKHAKPKELVARAPNQVWTWDITYLARNIQGLYFFLYMIVDIYSRKIVGWTVQEKESADHASNLMIEACLAEQIQPGQVVLHSDNGSPMKGATLLATLYNLGVMASFSRPSVSNDNPFSEALFKTVKYNAVYPIDKFVEIIDARRWVENFVKWYNYEHFHSGIKFVSPHQRHMGEDEKILAKRKAVYTQAKEACPARWSGEIRNWDLINEVVLNPGKPLAEQVET